MTEFVDQTMKLRTQSGEIIVCLLSRPMVRMIWGQTHGLLIDTLLLGDNAAQNREPIVAAQDVVKGAWGSHRSGLYAPQGNCESAWESGASSFVLGGGGFGDVPYGRR
jgi:hypothetical protein